MIKQSNGRIFLAEERGVNETDWFSSFNTFNFGRYQLDHKKPIGNLYVLNDDTLAAGRSMSMLIEEDSFVIVLPVVGAVQLHDDTGHSSLVVAGQAQVITVSKDTRIVFSNPFKDGLTNYLQLWVRAGTRQEQSLCQCITFDDVNEHTNQLLPVMPLPNVTDTVPFSISIGKFSGRGETVFTAKEESKSVFAFVLEGAFEVEGRLLHARDGLVLYDCKEVEMEALSTGALLLIIEQ